MLVVERTDDLAACRALRHRVFVIEQKVPEALEGDEHDATALHILARKAGDPIGAARVVSYGTTAKIGRVCVLPEHRGSGVGVALIEACQFEAAKAGATRAILGAQLSAIGFYERLGYRAYGEVFDDAGIDHKMMECVL